MMCKETPDMLPTMRLIASLACPGRTGMLSVEKLAHHLVLDMTTMARLLRVHRNTLHRLPYGMKAQRRMGEVVEILHMAEVMCWKGDETPGLIVLWFKGNVIPGLGGTAMEMVREGKGEAVMAYLWGLADGVYA